MTTKQKLILKHLDKRRQFGFTELKALLSKLAYKQGARGMTSGSRMAFESSATGHLLIIHRPHKDKNLKPYLRNMIVKELEKYNLI